MELFRLGSEFGGAGRGVAGLDWGYYRTDGGNGGIVDLLSIFWLREGEKTEVEGLGWRVVQAGCVDHALIECLVLLRGSLLTPYSHVSLRQEDQFRYALYSDSYFTYIGIFGGTYNLRL